MENSFESKAEKKRLGEVAGKWLQVDGVHASWMGGEPRQIDTMPEHAGTYAINNETISFVNSEGEVFISKRDLVNIEDLEDAGYEKGNFGVPFSNSEAFVSHPTMGKEWQDMTVEQKRFSSAE